MSSLGYFSAVPGAAVPGMAQPGRDQQFSYPLYLYAGPWPLTYLDYLDTVTGHTLTVAPGGFYSMAAVNSRAGLTVPPPDSRWDTGPGAMFRVVRTRPASAAEARAARERALIAHGHYVSAACPHCEPPSRESVTLARRVPGPDFAPRPPAKPPVTADEARAAHGHYPGSTCRQCDPAPAEPEPVVSRVAGPDFAPQPSMAQVRADLERSRVAHGHYAPGGCRLCMSGGREDGKVVV